jgi:hypothetical protein
LNTLLAGLQAPPSGEVPLSLKMTWEEMTGFSGLLDDYPGARLAFSVSRKLRDSYAGAAFRVRRASDNAEQDIGFDGSGNLDTAALLSFCAGVDGHVKCVYDQSGNGHDFAQTSITVMPKIVNGGALITENGQPAMQYDGNDSLLCTDTIVGASDYSSFFVANRSDTSGYFFDTQTGRFILDNPNSGYYWQSGYKGAGFTYTGQHLLEVYLVAPSAGEAWQDNVQQASGLVYAQKGVSVNSGLGANYTGGANGIIGTIQEFVLYDSDQKANRAGIVSNINAHFSVF